MNAITGERGRLATRAPFVRSHIGDVAVRWSANDGLVEVIFRSQQLPLELVDIGLAFLDIKGASGVVQFQLSHLREPQFLELELRAD